MEPRQFPEGAESPRRRRRLFITVFDLDLAWALAVDLAWALDLDLDPDSDLLEMKRPEVRRGCEHGNRQPTNPPTAPNPEPAQP